MLDPPLLEPEGVWTSPGRLGLRVRAGTGRPLRATQAVHNRALGSLRGVPAVVRMENEATAIATEAGRWGQVAVAYGSCAKALRFHIDATCPRQPQEKGKVERRIRSHRQSFDLRGRTRSSTEKLRGFCA